MTPERIEHLRKAHRYAILNTATGRALEEALCTIEEDHRIMERLADQQAMPDDSWKDARDKA